MAYEPKEWVCGDTITADDLNRMEQGIQDASNVAVMNVESVMNAQTQMITVTSCDMTAQDVFDLMSAGKTVVANVHMDVQVNGDTVQDNYIAIMLDLYDATHLIVTGERHSLEESSNYIAVTRLSYSAQTDLPSITMYNKTL